MYNSMPPTNPRKRAAPGASPTPQMTQTFPAANPMSNPDYVRWNQGAENASFPDPSDPYNMNTYNANNLAQPPTAFDQQQQQQQASSTQLARRPVNRQLVATAQRYDNGVENWGQYVDDPMVDPQTVNGPLEESDNIELLEERASVAKRDALSKRKQIPPFVQKLSSFLEESRNTELIRWSDRGDSFVVLDEDEFAKTLIPELFKHNNYASFVRQLNMYGFHKRVGLSDNSMKASERKNKSPSEYYNPYFKRGHPNLLWLINKPKGGTTKTGKVPKKKTDDNQERDSDEDGQDIEEVYGNNVPRALSAVPESAISRQTVANLQSQMGDIQKRQGVLSSAITQLRKEQNNLYSQGALFQTLHDRHENSINAILTFLATVYNRSLDGQGAQNIAQMFQNGIPTEQQHQGSVVDVTGQQDPHPGSLSPHRRHQRLLMAPPGGNAASTSPSTASTPHPSHQPYQTPGAIEELFDSPNDNPTPKTEPNTSTSTTQPPSQNMMNIINNTNAQARTNTHNIQFPDMVSHYENTHNRPSLTETERNSLLNNILNVNSPPNSNNPLSALVSPSPQPSFDALSLTQAEIDELVRLQKEQDERIESIRSIVEPMSPSGSIPGLDGGGGRTNSDGGGGYFSAADFGLGMGGDGNLDMDQFLDGDAFYGSGTGGVGGGNGNGNGNGNAGSSPGVDFGGGYDGFGGSSGGGAFDDIDAVVGGGAGGVGLMDGVEGNLNGNGNGNGGIVNGTRALTPDGFGVSLSQGQGQEQSDNGGGVGRSPSKRRRKN